jgi:hypothetical protein
MADWHLTARPVLRFRDRLRLLVGVPLFVRFRSPDGHCHAACEITASVQRDWPADADVLHGGGVFGFEQKVNWRERFTP